MPQRVVQAARAVWAQVKRHIQKTAVTQPVVDLCAHVGLHEKRKRFRFDLDARNRKKLFLQLLYNPLSL